jgi:hypothetical protein
METAITGRRTNGTWTRGSQVFLPTRTCPEVTEVRGHILDILSGVGSWFDIVRMEPRSEVSLDGGWVKH